MDKEATDGLQQEPRGVATDTPSLSVGNVRSHDEVRTPNDEMISFGQLPQTETPLWNQGKEEIPFRKAANEDHIHFVPANYWQDLAARQDEAALVIELEKLQRAIKEHGGSKAVCVFDPWEADQIHSSHMYLGYASNDSNNKEGVHVHMLQTEFYISLKGTAEIWTKRYWEGSEAWERRVLRQGDVAIVWPQTCHFFQVCSPQGITAVTKSPNTLGGVGRPPAAKLNCPNCPRLNKGCDGLKAGLKAA